jgi:hypothetical protein
MRSSSGKPLSVGALPVVIMISLGVSKMWGAKFMGKILWRYYCGGKEGNKEQSGLLRDERLPHVSRQIQRNLFSET